MSIRRAHWQSLAAAGLMPEPPELPLAPPWYVRALQALGAWIASLFVVGALLLVFGRAEEAGLGIIGSLSLALAFILLRAQSGDFVYQTSIALSLAGQLCLSLSVGMSFDTFAAALVAAAVAAALIVVMDDFAHRLIATMVLAGAVFVAVIDIKLERLAVPILALPFAAMWGSETRWAGRRSLFEPVALGMGFGLLAGSLFAVRFGFHGLPEAMVAQALRIVVVLGCLGYVVLGVLEDCGVRASRRWQALSIVLVATLAVELAVANAATALLVFAAAMRAQRAVLAVAALLALLVLVSHRYYTLELTLLAKSLWLMGAGAVLLALHQLVRRLWFARDAERAEPAKPRTLALGAIVSVLACVTLAGTGVSRSETLLSEGDVMVLALAPVDPRSLMQGDYMALDFAVQRRVRQQLREQTGHRGWVVLRVDEDGVAQFDRVVRLRPEPEPGVFVLRYGWDGRRLNMLTNAFFFEEGTAEVYNAARFGAFRVDDDGSVMLVQMLDASQQVLGAQF